MKKFSFIFALLLAASAMTAQGYFTSAGVRLGDGFGVTVQQRIGKKTTVEGILSNSFNRDDFMITGLVERHVSLITRRLNFYSGIGLHKGFSNNVNFKETYDNAFGVTGVAGLELSLGRMNLSYDFKPALNITGGSKVFYPETALSLRYVLVKDKFYQDHLKARKKKKRKKARAKRKANGGGLFNFGN